MSPLRDRRFVLLLAGQAVNGIGSWCALIAMWGYAAYRFDANPIQIAMISLSWALPGALFGPLAGVPVDRLGPRRALIIADGSAALVSFALIFTDSFAQLVALGVCLGLARSVSDPSFSALAPRLVDDSQLLRANALLGAAMMSSIAFGPLLAAGAIAAWGPRGAFAVDVVTYAIGIAVVVPLRLRPIKDHDATLERTGAWQELRVGLAFVRSHAAIRRILTLSASVYLVWGAYAVIEPIYVRDILHRSPAVFALFQAAFGAMLLVNSLLVSRVGDRVATMKTLQWAALASAAAAPIYVGTNWIAAALVAICVWGAATAWLIAPQNTLLQRATPTAAHGRVLAIDSALRSWAHVIALPTSALIIGWGGVHAAALTFALMPIIGVLVTRRQPTPVTGDAPAPTPPSVWTERGPAGATTVQT